MQTIEKRLRKVSIGIGLILTSNLVLMAYILSFCLPIISGILGNRELARGLTSAHAALGFTLTAIMTVLGIAGACLCLAAPREVKGTGYLLIAIALSVTSLAAGPLILFLTLPAWISSILLILPYISGIFVLLFGRRLATFLGRQDLSDLGSNILLLAAGGIATSIAFVMLQLQINQLDGLGMMITLGAYPTILCLAALAYLRYLRFLKSTRQATLAHAKTEQTM